MSEELSGNCLIVQCGCPTAVTNAALAGFITEALNHGCIEEIYGALNGLSGLLQEQIIDLAEESQQAIRALRNTPGAALGTSKEDLRFSTDFERLLEVLKTHDIRYLFVSGACEEMITTQKIDEAAKEAGYDIRVLGIPQSINNDLSMTDHAPGYGSAVKYLCCSLREISVNAKSVGNHDLVTIVEVEGLTSGWSVAGTSLARRRDRMGDAPHILCMPELAFDPNKFLSSCADVLKTERHCVVVVSKGLSDENGNYLTFDGDAPIDGNETTAGEYLTGLVNKHMSGVTAKKLSLDLLAVTAAHMSSLADSNESFIAGRTAVIKAVEGASGKMITLVRGETDHYSCDMGISDLAEVNSKQKTFPQTWLNEDGISVSYQFNKYALPLIQGEMELVIEHGLPVFAELAENRVQKLLKPYRAE